MLKTFHKYKAIKVTVDDIKFDSKLESNCYKLLKDSNLKFDLQPIFELQPKFKYAGKTIQPIRYKSDFLVKTDTHNYILDSKGMLTPEFKLKRKLLLYTGEYIICISSLLDMNNFIKLANKNLEPQVLDTLLQSEKKARKRKPKIK